MASRRRDPRLEEQFYAAKIPPEARARCTERLTLAGQMKDLVDAHLKPNFLSFGSLDKTLAGFFIIDDTGDDYLLLDLREPNGQLYFQEHDAEVRAVKVRFDSLAAWARGKQSRKVRNKRKPTTERLWHRYLWISVLLDQSRGAFAERDAISTAVEAFVANCNGDEAKFLQAFERERRSLGRDPHLAIYWLLHFTLTADEARRAEVLAQVGKSPVPLVRAFVERFGELRPHETLEVLPSFRQRRARFAFEVALRCAKDPLSRLVSAFEIDPKRDSVEKALAIAAHARERAVAVPDSRAPGVLYLRARLHRDKVSAARFVRAVALAPETELDFYGEALSTITDLVGERPLETGAAQRLLAHDPWSEPYLKFAIAAEERIAQKAELEQRLAAVSTISSLLEALRTSEHPDPATLAKLKPAVREVACRKVLSQPTRFPHEVLQQALAIVARGNLDDSRTSLARALIEAQNFGPVLKTLAARVRKGDVSAVKALWSLVLFNDKDANPYRLDYLRKDALLALTPVLTQEPHFTRLLDTLEPPTPPELTATVLDAPLNRWQKKASVLSRLAPSQRLSLAQRLLTMPLPRRPALHNVRSALEAIFSPALHAELLAWIEQTNWLSLTHRYASFLATFVAREGSPVMKFVASGEPTRALLSREVKWRLPDAGQLKYVLLEHARAMLDTEPAKARALWRQAQRINAKPVGVFEESYSDAELREALTTR